MSLWTELYEEAVTLEHALSSLGSRAEAAARRASPGDREARRLVNNVEVAGRWLQQTVHPNLRLLKEQLLELDASQPGAGGAS